MRSSSTKVSRYEIRSQIELLIFGYLKLRSILNISNKTMSTKEVYYLTTTSTHLSVEEGNTDIDESTRPTKSSAFVCNDHGFPPRIITFTAAKTRPTAATTSSPSPRKPKSLRYAQVNANSCPILYRRG